MIEAAILVMQLLSALVMIAGGVLTFTHALQRDGVAAFGTNEFRIDHRRVLGFARLATHH